MPMDTGHVGPKPADRTLPHDGALMGDRSSSPRSRIVRDAAGAVHRDHGMIAALQCGGETYEDE